MKIANSEDLAKAIAKMRAAGTDTAEFELKTAAGGVPKSIAETVSAFANTEGGTIILGISEETFAPTPALDVKKMQSSLAQIVREAVVPAIEADINILKLEGKPVVVANIPELAGRDKPCYVKKQGRISGSYIRTGDGDHHLTLYELDRFIENQQRTARFDADPVEGATLADLDKELLSAWIQNVRKTSFGRAENLDDVTLMANRRVIAPDETGDMRPTIAGLMALGAYPQKFFPRLNVVFTSYAMSVKGEESAQGLRFRDSANLDGSISQMIVDCLKVLSRNIKHGAIVSAGLRADIPDYPLDAVREAIANALMHRDYSPESQGAPVLVEHYPDRLVISNPGGLYGALTLEQLGAKSATLSRNQFLSRILEDVSYTDVDGRSGHVVENRGTGIPTIKASLANALMEEAVFASSLNEFSVTFYHRKMTPQEGNYSRENVQAGIIDYVRAAGSASSAELAHASGLSTKTIREHINILLEAGVLEGVGSQYSPKRRYRLAGK